ncbi:hypothetical protein JB92DRAFT_3105124 [Gautieria morchelliformis]|nr:hypothetical protein JB92DRAFT_3105124 [Gautieria morchelliformis]
MAPKKSGAKKRLENLGKYAKKKSNQTSPILQKQCPSIPSPTMDHSPDTALSDVSFSAISRCSSITSFDDVESTPDDLGVEDEGHLLTFISKLQQGITNFLDAAKTSIRPMRYNKMGNPAPRTKHQHEHDMQKSRKAYPEQGYADISSFFQKWPRECATDSGIQPAVCDKPKEQIEERQEEEEEVDERDVVPIMPMTGANLRQEEEESEEEGASNNKGLSTATDPQSIASSASGSEKNERHGQHVPRVTIEEIEDEDPLSMEQEKSMRMRMRVMWKKGQIGHH